jgi:ribosomal protein L30
MLKVTLVRSTIGFDKTQAATVQGMGLRKIRHTVELPTRPKRAG